MPGDEQLQIIPPPNDEEDDNDLEDDDDADFQVWSKHWDCLPAR